MSFKDFLKKCAIVILATAAGAGLGLAGGAAAGTFMMPVVGTAAGGIVGATAGAVVGAVAAVIDVFFGATSRTLMSAEDYPPISTVLANHERADLVDSMRSAVKTDNANAMDKIGKQLTKLGLDYIFEAFKRAIRDKLRCYKCRKNVTRLDDLCYCPGAATNCHHNSKSCCVHHRERGMFEFASSS